jgi:hypothetical protein
MRHRRCVPERTLEQGSLHPIPIHLWRSVHSLSSLEGGLVPVLLWASWQVAYLPPRFSPGGVTSEADETQRNYPGSKRTKQKGT